MVSKISPAFEPFLADSGEDGKRDAIVIYRTPPIEGLHLRGRLREIKRRMDEVKQQATIQKSIEQRVLTHYNEVNRDRERVTFAMSINTQATFRD
jgi:hypothetical protein